MRIWVNLLNFTLAVNFVLGAQYAAANGLAGEAEVLDALVDLATRDEFGSGLPRLITCRAVFQDVQCRLCGSQNPAPWIADNKDKAEYALKLSPAVSPPPPSPTHKQTRVTPTARPRGLCLSGGCGASQSVAFLERAPIYKCKVAGTPSWPDRPKGTPQGSSPRGPVSFSRESA